MSSAPIREIDTTRLAATQELDPARRSSLGQFMTPTLIADYMASLFTRRSGPIRLLDPGAGIGSLTEAFATRFLREANPGTRLEAHCYEIEPALLNYLTQHCRQLEKHCAANDRKFISVIHDRDFIREAAFAVNMDGPRFTHAILNPPYKKINTDSDYRRLLRTAGIETVNLYTAFLALTIALMEQGGEIVAIIPRSFCNGTYYRPFREYLLSQTQIKHIHVFESRRKAFKDDEVLQENIIIHLIRSGAPSEVTISTSHDATMSDYHERQFQFSAVVKREDPECFIHIPTIAVDANSPLFSKTLKDLGIAVSTGPVVDFRLKDHWLPEPQGECAPLLYAHHFRGGKFTWWTPHKKPNAVTLNDETRKWLMPRGFYTITKRFSSKEERRRLVAYVADPSNLPYDYIGFENHLNIFHRNKTGLDEHLSYGLALFLNSTVADQHFRNFSGHTQVNATDLRSMLYPNRKDLERFGNWAKKQTNPPQEQIDAVIEGRNG